MQDATKFLEKLARQGYDHVASQFKKKKYAGWKIPVVEKWLKDNKDAEPVTQQWQPPPKAAKAKSEIKPKVEKKPPAKKAPAAKSKK